MTTWYLHVESKEKQRGGYQGLGKWGATGQRVQSFSYKINKFCGSNV